MKQSWLQKILDFSIQYPKRTFFLWGVFLLLIFSQVRPFKMLITIDGLINENFETAKSFRDLKEKFEDGTPLILFQLNSLNTETLCENRKWLTEIAKKENHLTRSYSLFSLRSPTLLDEQTSFPRLIFPSLLELDCETKKLTKLDAIYQSPWNGIILNQGRGAQVTELRFHPLEEENFQSKVIPKIVKNLKEELPDTLRKDSWWVGEAAYQYFMKEGLKVNNALNLLLLMIVLILMRIFLGTWKSGFSFIGTLIFSALILFSMMAATGTPLDVLNNSLFILLSVASLGDFIFLCHYQQRHQSTWQESFRAVLIPSFFTSLTTFMGFISLLTSDLDIVKRLGLWAALSGVIEWLVLFSLLPAVLSSIKGFKQFGSSIQPKALTKLNNLEKVTLNKVWVIAFFLIYIASPFSPKFFNINDNPTMLFPKEHDFYRGIEALKDNMGFSGEISLVLKREKPLSEDLQSLELLTEKLKTHQNIKLIETPKAFINFMEKDFNDDIKSLIHQNLSKTPAYKKLIHNEAIRAKVYLNQTSLRDLNEMRIFVDEHVCVDFPCSLSGALIAYAEFSQTVPKTLLTSLGTSLIMVCLVLILLWRKRKEGPLLPLLVSGFWGVAFILVLLAASQFKLNFVTCVVLAILVGTTGDNAIHYLLGAGDLVEGIEEKQGASVLTITIMSICCVVFFFFSFQPPRVLGILLVFGLWGSLAGDLWFLKALIKKGRD